MNQGDASSISLDGFHAVTVQLSGKLAFLYLGLWLQQNLFFRIMDLSTLQPSFAYSLLQTVIIPFVCEAYRWSLSLVDPCMILHDNFVCGQEVQWFSVPCVAQ